MKKQNIFRAIIPQSAMIGKHFCRKFIKNSHFLHQESRSLASGVQSARTFSQKSKKTRKFRLLFMQEAERKLRENQTDKTDACGK
jgi:hypothetical protein